ncbi:peptidylprolyl isomerase [Paenibacillus sp. SYP-B3998]|uniref:peptidylprolyl isomerase n=1 Tax=Paenibacillus sp. SYP-B3998 TaxID=2678564 RepID=A0A6G4A0E3_9BACL|nr:peptidyl-prolyl cis-trans isomerase [Paenibacillus sp. SYP-B3998]NEW07933.1 peptidylprolyl isomerase [Paenibacillus sp. SYP-B3998]
MNIKHADRKWVWASSLLTIALIVYAIFYPPVLKTAAADKAVAKVNGVNISSTQLYEAMLAGGGAQTLDSLISNEIINQEGKKAGLQVTEADINEELASVKGSYGSEDEFQQALTSYGMTLNDLKKSMQSQVLLKKILMPQVTITDEEIKKYYNDNLESLKAPEQVQASHISVNTKEDADAILASLKAGGDFAAIAKEKSLDTATKDKGGDLGYMSSEKLEQAEEASVFALPVGGISDAIKTSTGYDIMKVTDHKPASTPTLNEKKEDIKKSLTQQKLATLSSTWLQQKRSESTVENYLTTKA